MISVQQIFCFVIVLFCVFVIAALAQRTILNKGLFTKKYYLDFFQSRGMSFDENMYPVCCHNILKKCLYFEDVFSQYYSKSTEINNNYYSVEYIHFIECDFSTFKKNGGQRVIPKDDELIGYKRGYTIWNEPLFTIKHSKFYFQSPVFWKSTSQFSNNELNGMISKSFKKTISYDYGIFRCQDNDAVNKGEFDKAYKFLIEACDLIKCNVVLLYKNYVFIFAVGNYYIKGGLFNRNKINMHLNKYIDDVEKIFNVFN